MSPVSIPSTLIFRTYPSVYIWSNKL
uniref:Uncharacterized protein n=1 Tax=Rhizophora mucronata TaxID=61149 RepID=A0A2P2PUJ3_RHIMU